MTYKELIDEYTKIEAKFISIEGYSNYDGDIRSDYSYIKWATETVRYIAYIILYINDIALLEFTRKKHRVARDIPDEILNIPFNIDVINNTKALSEDVEALNRYKAEYNKVKKMVKQYGTKTKFRVLYRFMPSIDDVEVIAKSKYSKAIIKINEMFNKDDMLDDYIPCEYDCIEDLTDEEVERIQKNTDEIFTSELIVAFTEFMIADLSNYITDARAARISNETIQNILGQTGSYKVENLRGICDIFRGSLFEVVYKYSDFTKEDMWPMKKNLPYIIYEATKDIKFGKQSIAKAKLLNNTTYNGRDIMEWLGLIAIRNVAKDILDNKDRVKCEW